MRLFSVILILGLLWCVSVFAQSDVVVSPESGAEYRAGLELFNARDYAGALPHFEQAYELDERNINALFAHGLTLSRMGEYADAAGKFREVLAIDPAHQNSLKMLPSALEATGDIEGALAAYDQGIQALPDNSYFYLHKAVTYLKTEQYDEAIALLEKAGTIDPADIDIKVRLMLAYRERGDMQEAVEMARTILAANEGHAQARVVLADYLREQEQYDDALKAYRLAARDIETKAYAEHYIQVIEQILEELEIEREYEARQRSLQQ